MKKDAGKSNIMANDLCRQSRFSEAVDLYTSAILLNPTATYFINRSSANLKLLQLDKALEDANQGIAIDPSYPKGYSKRGEVHMAKGQYQLAIEDYERANQIDTNNTRLTKRINTCKKLIQQKGNYL